MPREGTRQPARQEAARSALDVQIRHTERAVRVSLSGILDRDGVAALAARVAPGRVGRGVRIVLDGSGLIHMDYRATRSLIAWHRRLHRRGHALFLQGWSDYLKAILVMEDWDCDRSPAPTGLPTLRHLGSLAAVRMP
jgi:anti-anti-sigma regulatory factor